MKQIWKNIIVCCTSLFLAIAPMDVSQSCSYSLYSSYEYRVELFNPKVLNEPKFESFHYTEEFMNGSETDNEIDYIRNCKEWQQALGQSVYISDIYEILYEKEADLFLTAYHLNSLSEDFPYNTFIKALVLPQNKDVLFYLKSALQIQFSHMKGDPWEEREYEYHYRYWFSNEDYQAPPEKKIKWQNINDSLEIIIHRTSSIFLKERCGYQLVVNYRYMIEPKRCLDAFKKYLSNSSSILKSWGYIHKAYALHEMGEKVAANFALALSFSGCESKKIRAIQGFDERLLDSTFMLATTPDERVAVHALSMSNNPGRVLDAIQTIVAEKPDYDYLPLLLVREVNKIENWLLAPFLINQVALMDIDWEADKRIEADEEESYWSIYDDNPTNYDFKNDYYSHKNYHKDIAYLRQFRAELLKWSKQPAARKHQDFLNLAISYLYFLDFQKEISYQYLSKVSTQSSIAIQAQVHIQKILLIPRLKDITSAKVQKELFQSLNWLDEYGQSTDYNEHSYRDLSQLHLYLARFFYKENRMVEAGLLYTQTTSTIKGDGGNSRYYSSIVFFDKYATVEDVDEVLRFLDKPNKTAFENYLLSSTYFYHDINWKATDPIIEEPKEEEQEKKKKNFEEEFDEIEIEIPRTMPPPPPPPPPPPYDIYLREKAYEWKMDIDTSHQGFKFRLYDVQGTIAFRQDSLEVALRCFSKLPKNYWKEVHEFHKYLDDPFANYDTPDKERYYQADKRKIVERMIQLKNDGSPDSLYLLAQVHEEFTWYGDAWMMFSYGKFPGERENRSYNDYTFYPNSERYEDEFYYNGRAKQYYQQVYEHPDVSRNMKAWALYCIGKTNRKKYNDKHPKAWDDDSDERYVPSEFYVLQRDFQDAQDYSWMISCTGLEDLRY